eukprot:451379-Prymnesium_polylepis.2
MSDFVPITYHHDCSTLSRAQRAPAHPGPAALATDADVTVSRTPHTAAGAGLASGTHTPISTLAAHRSPHWRRPSHCRRLSPSQPRKSHIVRASV